MGNAAAIASASTDAYDALARQTREGRDAHRDDRREPAKKTRLGPTPGPVAPVVTTVTTTTTTTTISEMNIREDDMGALARRLAEYVGSYGSMDARDLLGVPCGGQMLCDALARAAADTSRF